jgi:hypothetical protein
MALRMVKGHKILTMNKDMMEDGRQERKKGMESCIILMEAIIKEIFQIIKSMVKGSIIGQEKVFIKDIGFIIKNVGWDQ